MTWSSRHECQAGFAERSADGAFGQCDRLNDVDVFVSRQRHLGTADQAARVEVFFASRKKDDVALLKNHVGLTVGRAVPRTTCQRNIDHLLRRFRCRMVPDRVDAKFFRADRVRIGQSLAFEDPDFPSRVGSWQSPCGRESV